MPFTRRDFITRMARAGGFGAAFMTMHSLGLLGMEETGQEKNFPLLPSAGRGTKVIILGAGIAGMVAAYEMRRAGFACTILEARSRPGGRNWTLRRGSKLVFDDGTSQECAYEQGHYFNCGPARLPSIHKTMLGYCKELGVELEVEVNSSRRTLLQNDKVFGGKPIRQGQAINDIRGHVSELLAKCVQKGALDQEFTPDDHAVVLAFLRGYGALSADFQFKGTSRSGDIQLPGAGDQVEVPLPPLAFAELLTSKFAQPMMFEEVLDMQPTMFQPVGGMDRIAYAFAHSLGKLIHYNSPITEIRKSMAGVRVTYRKGESGALASIEAPYCICTVPLPVLRNIPNDFAPRVKAAIEQVPYDSAYKVAWETRRFWEQDGDEIYGGISFLAGPVNVVWYPSAKLMSARGVLVAGYGMENFGDFGKLPSVEAKIAASRAAIEKLHPGKGREMEKPMYICWGRVPYSLGSWVSRGPEYPPLNEKVYYEGPYRELIVPDDRIYFAGDHCSHIIGWQEGAALAAQRAVGMIAARIAESQTT